VTRAHDFGVATTTGLGFDGHNLWVRVLPEGAAKVYQYDVGQIPIRLVSINATSGTILDFAFEGQSFWTIGTVNIRLFDRTVWNSPLKSFAHGHSGATGLTTDGQQLISIGSG